MFIKKQSNFISSLLVSQKRLEKKVSKGQQYLNLGTVYDSLGDYKKQSNFISSLYSIAKKIGEKGFEGTAYTNLVISYYFLGDYKKAIEFHQQSLSIAKGIGEKGSEGTAYTLALRITLSVFIKKQSNFISGLLVSPKR